MSTAIRHHEHCGCAGVATGFTLTGTQRQYERSRPFQVEHLALDLVVDVQRKAVQGSARLRLRRLAPNRPRVELDARGFEIHSVRLKTGRRWHAADHEYDGDCLAVPIPVSADSAELEIQYRAEPRLGLYFLAPDAEVPDRPEQVWSQCQDEDARHWFPCHDKPHVKMSTELKVQVPHGFAALSNGELVASSTPQRKGQPWKYHYKMAQPHPSYLLTLVVGKFDVLEDREANVGRRRIPVSYWVPPGRAEDGWRAFGQTPRMVELFSRWTGVPYPFSRYSQVVVSDFVFGGMENTTATTMYEHVLVDGQASLDIDSHDLVAHELAHQWFGDYVTCRDWSHAWLNEGFATFFEHLEREDRLGRDEYDYGIAADLDAYLSEANTRYQRPIVCRDYAEPIDLFDRHLYQKGGLVLHMLRRELTDEIFRKGVQLYLRRHEHGIVESTDLQRAFEQVAGRSLEAFFDHWVHRPGHPTLKVSISWEDGLLCVAVQQQQKVGDTALFALPLEIEVSYEGKTRRASKQMRESHDSLVMELPKRPDWVGFDPELRIAAAVELDAPSDMLQRQLAAGSSALLRWKAAAALGRRDEPTTIVALGRALAKGRERWMVRAEAASALGRIRAPQALELLLGQSSTRNAKVRRAVIAALGGFRSTQTLAPLEAALQRDASYLVRAAAARSLGKSRQPEALALLQSALGQSSWADVVQVGALEGLAELHTEEAIVPIMDRTRYGVPTRARRAAVLALARLSGSRKVRRHLEELLDDRDPHLRVCVATALAKLGSSESRAALQMRLDHELDGRAVRALREALNKLCTSGQAERRRVNDELQSLREEIATLKARLSKLEGSKGNAHRPRSAPKPTRRRG